MGVMRCKEDTLITIQIDQMLAEKFGMEYVDRDGTKKNPYIIHRSSIGCYERTMALLIEKYAGAFPLWLSPTQIKVLPISDNEIEYANSIKDKLTLAGYRVEVDSSSEKIGYKIREARNMRIPFIIVVGAQEEAEGTVNVRSRKGEEGAMKLEDFVARVQDEIKSKYNYLLD